VNTGLYRRIAGLLALTIALLGLGILISTAWHGGGTVGFIIGAMFLGLGSGRLYLLRKRR
jgi:hypothetical protein